MDRTELETIIYEKDGPVARIVLNMPEKANIQTAQQVWDMEDGPGAGRPGRRGQGADREGQRQRVLRRPRHRGARRDARGLPDDGTDARADVEAPPLRALPVAAVASVGVPQGHHRPGPRLLRRRGHGVRLPLTDLTVASDDAYFQMPLPQGFGLPGAQTMIEPWVLMNFKRAAEYLFLAPTIDAAQALEWGMVNRVVPRDDLEATVEEMARTIAQMPLTTIMATKQGLKRAWEMMGMRVHLQNTADFCQIASGASDVKEFMSKLGGRRPRQFAEDARAASEGDTSA